MLLVPSIAFSAPDAESDFIYATGLFRKQRWQYAAEAFEGFLKEYPQHPRNGLARLYLGLSLNSLEQYAPARIQFEQFVKDNPQSRNMPDAKYRIGECSYYLKEFDKAIPQLTEYLQEYNGHKLNAWGSLMLGESYNAVEKWQQADAVLRPMIDSKEAAGIKSDTLFALAVCRQGQQKSEEAIQLFQQVIDLKSAALTPRAFARIGTIYYARKDFKKASEIWDQIVTEFGAEPIAASAALQSGVARFQLKQYDQAIAKFETVPADSTVSIQAGMWTGICRRELGQLDEARKELADAFEAAGDQPIAAEILFNRAQIEVLDGRKDTAARMFLDLADRWPKNDRAFDSLFNSAELNMESGDLTAARRILQRLRADFAETSATPRVGLLDGRLLLNEGRTNEAVTVLRSVAAAETSTTQDALPRNYHLMRALHKAGLYEEVIRVFEPLQSEFRGADATDFSGAFALAAMSCLEQKDYAKARLYADEFLKTEQRPERVPDALAARAVAAAHLKDFDFAEKDLSQLLKDFDSNEQSWIAAIHAAEAAWLHQNFEVSARFFSLAVNQTSNAKLHLSALSGAAWSQYRLQNFTEAAALFRRAYTEYPANESSIESRYMEATCMVDRGILEDAATRFLIVFDTLDKQTDDAVIDNAYFLDAGRMYARIQGEAGKLDDADMMWARIAERFDQSAKLDEILDEWAYLNLQNNRFKRSDEVYARLLDRFPESRFAGQARLSLAESQMQAKRLDVALREFTAIAFDKKYGAPEREAALYHAIDIHAAQRDWQQVIKLADIFATEYGGSDLAANVQLLYAEGLLDQRKFKEAADKLGSLQAAVVEGSLTDEPWTDRIWVALAEVALAQKEYDKIDQLTDELSTRRPQSQFMFQVWDVQGRRWKTQAAPDFAKARDWFDKVISDDVARGTETAARCQFQIAESYLLEGNHKEALREYYRVYLNYAYDEWRAIGLFQAAGCEVKLNAIDAARKSYTDLIRDFPASEYATKAKQQLLALEAESN